MICLYFSGHIFTDLFIIHVYPRQPLRRLTSPTRMALAIRGDPRPIPFPRRPPVHKNRRRHSLQNRRCACSRISGQAAALARRRDFNLFACEELLLIRGLRKKLGAQRRRAEIGGYLYLKSG